jgi:hypothetical protein
VIYALDVSLYVDGLLMTLALASVARTRSGVALLRLGAASLWVRMRRGAGRRASRASVRRPARKPANDDDHPAFALAA